jgi:hypothetical protein
MIVLTVEFTKNPLSTASQARDGTIRGEANASPGMIFAAVTTIRRQ